MTHVAKHLQRWLALAGLLAASVVMPAHAQSIQTPGAAAAISEAVQEGGSPYRPPSAGTANPAEDKRARCEALLDEIGGTSKRRGYASPGQATTNAQGRAVPKIERDDARKQLEETYRANCM